MAWHDAECGAYAADLPLWAELARESGEPILELGCGTGRVALHLARRGFEVAALDREPGLLVELERRSAAEELGVDCIAADARDFRLDRRFALIAAPMQLAELLGPDGRVRMLAAAAPHLRPGGHLAVSLLAEAPASPSRDAPVPPDVVERDGWIYSSLPLGVRRSGARIEIGRLRQVVSPAGDLSEEVSTTYLDRVSPGRLEDEGEAVGLAAAGRRSVAATPEHLGSTVILLEAR